MLIPRDPALLTSPEHGADLAAASRRYDIPLSDWLDVSTGINPRAYPVGAIDRAVFQHLPIDDSELRTAAKNYCSAPELPIAAAGSQVLIQWLPLVKTQLTQRLCRVAVPSIGYSEHAFRWRWAGHEILQYDPREIDTISALIENQAIDVLVVINAHNPLGSIISPEQLLVWNAQLQNNNGWLIVDEAFIDPTPEYSVVSQTQRSGLIVLRSLGKFFGLAGVRCGFAFAAADILAPLQIAIGPWNVSGPTLSVATAALRDQAWQAAMRDELKTMSRVNAELLQNAQWLADKKILRNALFNSVALPTVPAMAVEEHCARQGIRVRRIEVDFASSLLRFGLVDPDQPELWARYEQGIRDTDGLILG
jgi:cobalamin biosynthetic protein CobC